MRKTSFQPSRSALPTPQNLLPFVGLEQQLPSKLAGSASDNCAIFIGKRDQATFVAGGTSKEHLEP